MERRRKVRALAWTLGVSASGWERVIVALAALVGVTVLDFTGHIDSSSTTAIYGTIIGYMLGHGAGAAAERRSNGGLP